MQVFKGKSPQQRGFTLIELIVVLTIMSIIFGLALPKIENLSPRYAMRSAARSIASTLQYIQSQAILQGKTFAILYNFKTNQYLPVMPPKEGENYIPFEEWPRGQPLNLPSLVRFHSVIRSDNSEFRAEDMEEVPIRIDPLGSSGSHVVVLTNSQGEILSLKFNALTNTVDFYDGIVEFARL